MTDGRARLHAAHVAGDRVEAVALARQLASEGGWDQLVAATLVAGVDQDDVIWPVAVAELARMQAAEAVAADPGSEARWAALLEALVAAGRLEEAIQGVAMAQHMLTSATPWKRLVASLLEHGHGAAALDLLRNATERFADDGELWAMRAGLASDVRQPAEADQALAHAHRLSPRNPLAWMARGRIALAQGDEVAATHSFQTAGTLGAPPEMVESLGRLGALAWTFGW